MKRAIVIALSVILALVVAAPTVLAQGNGGAPGDVMPPSFDWPAKDPTAPPTDFASVGCTFPLHFELTGKAKTIELPDGGFIFTSPGLDVTVTNVDTGEEATFNITGSTFASAPDKDGIVSNVITGRNLAFDPAGVFLNIGRFTFALDQSDPEDPTVFEQQEGKGQAIDVCELLS
jgi:hypothetical protein